MAFATLACLVLQKPKKDLTPALFALKARTQMILVVAPTVPRAEQARTRPRTRLPRASPALLANTTPRWALVLSTPASNAIPVGTRTTSLGVQFVESALGVVRFPRKAPLQTTTRLTIALCAHILLTTPTKATQTRVTRARRHAWRERFRAWVAILDAKK